jgi:hypothetical protein
MLSLPTQEKFRLFILPHFNSFLLDLKYPDPVNISRFTVWADVDMYKKKEDIFVWGQDKHSEYVFSVFFDGIHICYINDSLSKQDTLKSFWKGFLKAYSLPDDDPGKIWLDKSIYEKKLKESKEKKKKERKQIEDAIRKAPEKNESSKEAKAIALDAIKSSSTTT